METAVILNVKWLCLVSAALLLSFSVHAQIYKWVDENGQTHYSQQPPESGQAEMIDVPPPPPINPDEARDEVQELIEQQQAAEQAELEAEQQARQAAEQEAVREENCRIARENLRSYQNNPGRRIMDQEGNVTRLTEEDRQQKIQEFQEQVDLYCQ
ncbi:MAG: DUF4124 domain-containing protein [Methylophaga sp.]|nr:DUF4124 domain-containing protein [Methylophaga sp.]